MAAPKIWPVNLNLEDDVMSDAGCVVQVACG